jgi:hypothetical protein
VAALGTLAAAPLAPAAAQGVVVELSAGGAVGNYTETGAGLDLVPGPAFGARVELWAMPTLAGYAGVTRATFGCEEGICTGRDLSLTSQGLVVGAQWSPGIPWVRAGVAFQGLTIRDPDVEESFDPGLGFELSAGADVPVWGRFRVRPGIVWLRHDASTDLGDGHVSLLALQLGVAMELLSF